MATIRTGKHKDKVVKIHQFCNNWFMIEHSDIPNRESIFSPNRLIFTDGEVERIKQAEARGENGMMFERYYWDSSNTMKKRGA